MGGFRSPEKWNRVPNFSPAAKAIKPKYPAKLASDYAVARRWNAVSSAVMKERDDDLS
jgi:hypothetical protein